MGCMPVQVRALMNGQGVSTRYTGAGRQDKISKILSLQHITTTTYTPNSQLTIDGSNNNIQHQTSKVAAADNFFDLDLSCILLTSISYCYQKNLAAKEYSSSVKYNQMYVLPSSKTVKFLPQMSMNFSSCSFSFNLV